MGKVPKVVLFSKAGAWTVARVDWELRLHMYPHISEDNYIHQEKPHVMATVWGGTQLT